MSTPTVTKTVLENGARNYVAQFVCPFTTGDTLGNYVALDGSSGGDMGVVIAGQTFYPGVHLKLMEARYDISDGLSVEMLWDATSAYPIDQINGLGGGHKSYLRSGGLFIPTGTVGATGKLLLTVVGTVATGQFFSLYLAARKDISQ